LGAAFALGPNVIAFSDGVAYQVLSSNATIPPIELPPGQKDQHILETDLTSTPKAPSKEASPSSETEGENPTSTKEIPCIAGMLPLVIFPLLGLATIQKSQQTKKRSNFDNPHLPKQVK
jgi:hypothetical protein